MLKHGENGRYIVATEHYDADSLVLSERVFLFAPSDDVLLRKQNGICFHCLRRFDPLLLTACDCSFQFCADCDSSDHKHRECHLIKILVAIYVQMKKQFGLSDLLLLTRVMMSASVEHILSLNSHREFQQRVLAERFAAFQPVATMLYAHVVHKHLRDRLATLTPDVIVDLWAILNVNCFGMDDGRAGIALAPQAAMFNHSCAHNVRYSWTFKHGSHFLQMTAAQPIEPQTELCISYHNDELCPTQGRRQFLYSTKAFWCHCQRCDDPVDMYLRGIRCNSCDSGWACPMPYNEPPDTFPDARPSRWRCVDCASVADELTQQCNVHEELLRTLTAQLDNARRRKDQAEMDEYQQKLLGAMELLHENNVQRFHGNISVVLCALQSDDTQRKIDAQVQCQHAIALCERVLTTPAEHPRTRQLLRLSRALVE